MFSIVYYFRPSGGLVFVQRRQKNNVNEREKIYT